MVVCFLLGASHGQQNTWFVSGSNIDNHPKISFPLWPERLGSKCFLAWQGGAEGGEGEARVPPASLEADMVACPLRGLWDSSPFAPLWTSMGTYLVARPPLPVPA